MNKNDKDYKYAKSLSIRWRNSKNSIIDKLIRKSVNKDKISKIIDSLEKDKILNEKETFDNEVFILEGKHYGYLRIKETLMSKGFSKTLVGNYVFNKEIEKENCIFYFKKGVKKYGNYKYYEGEREKLFSYLKRYGFNDKMIAEVLKEGAINENVA